VHTLSLEIRQFKNEMLLLLLLLSKQVNKSFVIFSVYPF